MAIKGNLNEASLADVIQLLSMGRKTGMLSLTDRSNFGSIFLEKGLITFAQIVNRRDRLGDTLVKEGRISTAQLETAISSQSGDRDRRIGEILVDQGALRKSELDRYMTVQIEEAVYFLFTWTSGSFHFEADVRPDEGSFLVSINPESLLLEGARRVDEWALIEKKIPSFDVVVALDAERMESSNAELTDDQNRLLGLIDGHRDVAQLIEDSALGEFEVGKALYGLMTAGFVHRSRNQAVRKRQSGPAQIDEHRNLGMAFYRTGMFEESQREFRRVIELQPQSGVAFSCLGLIALRQARWQEAVEHLKVAADLTGGKPGVLNNLALALERCDGGSSEPAYEEAVGRNRDDRRIMTGWAIAALRNGDHEVAAGRLERARELEGGGTPPAVWYWARSLAAGCAQDFDATKAFLEEGIENHPDNVVLKNNLAVVLELTGDLSGAEDLLTEAIRREPSVPQLHKNMGDLAYRNGQFDEAWDSYNLALKHQPELGDDSYFKLGNIAYKRAKPEEAAGYWKRALEINPNHELARTNLDTIEALR